jgi:hypothetical protein
MTGHYPRKQPSTNLMVKKFPTPVLEQLGRFCRRNGVPYREALVAIIPAGIKALTTASKGAKGE